MEWQQLEGLIHDNDTLLKQSEIEQHSTDILKSLNNDAEPLQAAKMAYVLALLQLKAKKMNQEKVLQFLDHMRQILKHEFITTEARSDEKANAHLLYIRKLAEHYLHHLLVLAEMRKADRVAYKVQKLRRSNHDNLLQLQRGHQVFWKRERQLIKKSLTKHYLFTGFLLSIALYFSWTTFWNLSDFVVSQWVYSEHSAESVATIIRQGLLLTFSISFVVAFVKYQQSPQLEVEGAA